MTSATGNNDRATPRAPCRGLTLIEVMVSVAILASASVLILQALARGAHTLALAKNRLRAYTFASAKLPDVELSLAQGNPPTTAGEFRAGHDQFEWRVDTLADPDTPELQQITLTVAWRQGPTPYETRVGTLRYIPPEEPTK